MKEKGKSKKGNKGIKAFRQIQVQQYGIIFPDCIFNIT